MIQTSDRLLEQLGGIDIYLLDQLLRGRLNHPLRLLDAGCGTGRNLVYFLANGYDVYACDRQPEHLEAVRETAATLGASLPLDRLRPEPVEALTFEDGFFGAVISCAVLHFADSEDGFDAMLGQMWRVLAPGGLLFCRLASSIGIEPLVVQIGGRRARLPDGSERFLVDEPFLAERLERLGGHLLDPLKTTVVQGMRSMSTWVVGKPPR